MSESQYRLLFESNPLPMWVYDVDTLRFLAVNAAAIHQYGYSEREFLAMTIADIRPPEDRARLGAHVVAHRDDVLQHSGIWRHLRRDGSPVDVEITSHSIDFGGRSARLVMANDVTARVRTEADALHARRELEDSRLLLRSVIDAADALVFAFDMEGRAILMNEACARVVGATRESLLGRRRPEVMPAEAAAAHEVNDRRVIESGEHLAVEETILQSGVEHVYLSVKYPLRDVEGRIYAVGGIATDITELRRMQQELSAANRVLEERIAERTREAMQARLRAEAADRAKTQFLTSVSHELRAPLHSVIGFTSVLLEGLEGELSAGQQGHLRVIADASQHLLAIINDLLDMSRIEAGAVALDRRPLEVGAALRRVVERVRLQARHKGLALQLVGPGEDLWIEGDERRIEQVVGNLVSNAVKYTPSGSVRVSCECVDDTLCIAVADTGPGIGAEDRERLFRRFSQLAPSPGGITEGAGLGLAIAAGFAEAMGGEIRLQSEPGSGSVFSLVLPLPVKERS